MHAYTKQEMKQALVAKLHNAGIRVMPYINGRLWDTHDKGTEDWQYSSVAYPKACKGRDGKAFNESYSSKEANGEHVVLSVMCPSTALWQEKVKSIVDKLVNDLINKELQEFISRFSANKSKSRQATARRKLLDKISLEEIPASSRRYPFIGFDMDREPGKEILFVDGLSKSLNGNVLFRDLSFRVYKDDKIAFVAETTQKITRA